MKICISGWYFHQPLLEKISDGMVIGHRQGETCGIPLELTPEGRGLDFGCYQQYLMNHWDGRSDVLFMQDDGEIHGSALEDISRLTEKAIDHAYIFRDEYEEFVNNGKSSRAMWCRGEWLKRIKEQGGFWVDWDNTGNTAGRQANAALYRFAQSIASDSRAGWIAIVPGLHMGRRGYIANAAYQYRRQGQGLITPEVA